MEEKNEVEKIKEAMLPGFRFHPTDEELVGFYLKKKVLQRPFSIELIKQLDIYKYDPWDLPKFAMAGEKEWYFFCPRDRKYRNSARPNRVTGAGFWKATGTDRPIYSSEGNKCIGLKKSLVFYRGRAAKGVKTDWMMHEFRLPGSVPTGDHSPSSKKFTDNPIPVTDSWAICRIFKKTNSTPDRALSQSFVSSSVPVTNTNKFNKDSSTPQFGSDNNTQQQTTTSSSCYSQFNQENIHTHQTSHVSTTAPPVSCLDFSSSYTHLNTMNHHQQLLASPLHHQDLTNYLFAPSETQTQFPKCTVNDVSSLLQLNMPSPHSFLSDYVNQMGSLSSDIDFNSPLLEELQCPALVTFSQELQSNGMNDVAEKGNVLMKNLAEDHYWETVRSVGLLPENAGFNQDLKQNLEFFLPPWQLEI